MENKKGKIIVIVAPSGAGKSTLIERLKKDFPGLSESISCTTRPVRNGETNGIQYNFITKEEFEKRINENDFIEWALVHGNYYGTSKSFVESGLSTGINLLFDLDVQGCDSFKNHYGSEAAVIFIEPPSIEELEKRLLSRGTESTATIKLRIENAKNELRRKSDFDHVVLNDDLEKAYSELKDIVQSITER